MAKQEKMDRFISKKKT